MRPAANNAAACNNVFDKIRMLINQMVSAGQGIRIAQDALWTEKILEKFPYSIVKNVLITTQSKDEVKIEDIMNELEKEIEAKKFVESRLRNFSKHDHNGERERYSSEELYKDSNACVFCKSTDHTSSYCRTVVGINERRDILKREQLCWKCFADSHRSSECPKRNCSRCKQMHDASVCFATGPVQKGNGSNDFNRPSSGFQPRNNIAPEPRNPRQIRGERQPWNGNNSNDARNNRPFQGRAIANNACVNSDNAKNQASEAKEQIVLMTAEGSVWNYNTDQFEKVLFFFDTGAQKTLIRERTAHDLALPKQSREMCAVSGIGGHTERFQSDVVTLKILTAHGMELDIKAQTKPIITSGFSSVNLSKEDKHFLQLNELWLCNPRVKGEHQTPHILVGLDYYYHLVPPDSKLIQLPSGLHIAKTIFGHSIHGHGIIPTQSNSSGIHERCSALSNDPESEQLIQQLTAISEPTETGTLNKLFELQVRGTPPDEMPSHIMLHRPLNKLYPLKIRSGSEAIEESLAEKRAVQSRPKEGTNIERTPSVTEPPHPPKTPHKNQERKSKTPPYEVIRKCERQPNRLSIPMSINSSLWTLITILLCAISTGSANDSLMCADGSAIVDIQNASFELCFNQECRTFINLSKKLVLKIPASPLHKLATVTARVLRNNYTETVECPPIAFCEYASQIMTSSLIGNPHCWPMGAIASIAIILYL
uniref:Peptidase A2 domain-containing protein n=1 Tax=Haemonchus contortus TaxID=6289 RepID=A0A7I5EAI6_HAECO